MALQDAADDAARGLRWMTGDDMTLVLNRAESITITSAGPVAALPMPFLGTKAVVHETAGAAMRQVAR